MRGDRAAVGARRRREPAAPTMTTPARAADAIAVVAVLVRLLVTRELAGRDTSVGARRGPRGCVCVVLASSQWTTRGGSVTLSLRRDR